MKRIKEQAEVIVRLDYLTQTVHICVSAWPKMANRMTKFYGPSKDRDTDNGSMRWEVPFGCISFRRPKAASKRAVLTSALLNK